MNIAQFDLERYFARHEFSARFLLSSSDCESLSLLELVELADEESIRLWIDLSLGYTESTGHPLLRELISDGYGGITAGEILTVVPEEGIFLYMHALLEPGDHVICTFPGYQSLYEIARSIGCEISFWQPEEGRGWHFNFEHLKDSIRPDTKLLVVNFPHNPTGFLPDEETFKAIVNLASSRGIHLLTDEMYRHLEIEPGSTLPAGCDLYERACSLSGLSKAYGLPGLRIGWVATRNRGVLKAMSKLKDYTTICSSAPSEILAIFALQDRETILEMQLDRVRRNVAVLEDFFAIHDEIFSWVRPKGGSISFPRLHLAEGATRFCNKLIENTGIMLAPSSVFDYGDQHVRVGFGRQDLPEVIGRFGEYIEQNYT